MDVRLVFGAHDQEPSPRTRRLASTSSTQLEIESVRFLQFRLSQLPVSCPTGGTRSEKDRNVGD